jgi:6-phosphogluconolactonase (cycloisomerase 2 family)
LCKVGVINNRAAIGTIHASYPPSFRFGRDGKVAFIGDTPGQSQSPRSIAFDPAGRFLISVTALGGAVAAFRSDPSTGVAACAGQAIALRQPRSIVFLP